MVGRAELAVLGRGVTGTMIADALGATHFGRETPIDEACARSRILVLAAGPYARTLDPAVDAAMKTGTHLVHLCCELPVLEALRARDGEVRRAGICVAGPAGFSTLVTELLTWLAARPLAGASRVSVAHAMTRVVPSRGTLESYLAQVDRPSFRWRHGELISEPVGARTHVVDFGPPIGPKVAVSAPLPEVLVVPWSLGLSECETYLGTLHPNAAARAREAVFFRERQTLERMLEVRRARPGPDDDEREGTHFAIAVRLFGEGEERIVLGHGRDPWRMSARAAGLVCRGLASGVIPGVKTSLEALEPQPALAQLAQDGLRWRFLDA